MLTDDDDDNDGVLDVYDHFPLDASQQYVPLSDATCISDPILRQCFEEQLINGSIIWVLCVLTAPLEGLEKFTHLALSRC